MEAYTTAEIEVISIEEDVITASVTGCEQYYYEGVNSTSPVGWTVHYDDGTSTNYSGSDKPSMCP